HLLAPASGTPLSGKYEIDCGPGGERPIASLLSPGARARHASEELECKDLTPMILSAGRKRQFLISLTFSVGEIREISDACGNAFCRPCPLRLVLRTRAPTVRSFAES